MIKILEGSSSTKWYKEQTEKLKKARIELGLDKPKHSFQETIDVLSAVVNTVLTVEQFYLRMVQVRYGIIPDVGPFEKGGYQSVMKPIEGEKIMANKEWVKLGMRNMPKDISRKYRQDIVRRKNNQKNNLVVIRGKMKCHKMGLNVARLSMVGFKKKGKGES